jgi:protein SCO1/2
LSSPIFWALAVLIVDASQAWQRSSVAAAAAQSSLHQTGVQRRQVQIPIGDFSLTDQSGERFLFKRIKGKVTLVAFAYTTCPDVCPLVTSAMRQAQLELKSPERDAVYFATVTTDPEVDQPKVLAAYAQRYGADLSNWAFLTGDEQSLNRVWQSFGVKVRRKARGLIDHTPLTAIVDQTGTMRVAYVGTAPDPKVILQDIRSLLSRRV